MMRLPGHPNWAVFNYMFLGLDMSLGLLIFLGLQTLPGLENAGL